MQHQGVLTKTVCTVDVLQNRANQSTFFCSPISPPERHKRFFRSPGALRDQEHHQQPNLQRCCECAQRRLLWEMNVPTSSPPRPPGENVQLWEWVSQLERT